MYTVVRSTIIDDLVTKVEALQADGWECLGGVATADTGGSVIIFLQALTKTE